MYEKEGYPGRLFCPDSSPYFIRIMPILLFYFRTIGFRIKHDITVPMEINTITIHIIAVYESVIS